MGIYTHKWLSHSLKVLDRIPEEYRATQMSLDSDRSLPVITLGVLWHANDDVFILLSHRIMKGYALQLNEAF